MDIQFKMFKNSKRMKWTEGLNRDVLECKKKAQQILSLDNPPLNQNGMKKGYIQLIKELWEDVGHGNYGLTGQNLRDQASRLEKGRNFSIGAPLHSKESKEKFDEGEAHQNAINHPKPSSILHTSSLESQEVLGVMKESAQSKIQPNLPDFDVFPSQTNEKLWGNISYKKLYDNINCIYRVFQKFVGILKSPYFIQTFYISLHFLTDINKSYCLSIFRTVL